jgi:hypothetical protein
MALKRVQLGIEAELTCPYGSVDLDLTDNLQVPTGGGPYFFQAMLNSL